MISRVGPTEARVLITGESGTGKELVAAALHLTSARRDRPFVRVNCAAIPRDLVESEMFGHERGAFTGATERRIGRFELAHTGTLFLDEVGDLHADAQAKLLRAIEAREIERVGGGKPVKVDVRILAATNKDLTKAVADGSFREDLFFRLNVVPLRLPPLRERTEDIPDLIRHFFTQAERESLPAKQIDQAALDRLKRYRWPGNVRELENLATRASILGRGTTVTADQLRPWLIDTLGNGTVIPRDVPASLAGMKLDEMERRLIESTLEQFRGHRAQTAQALGIGIRTLTNKLRTYGYAPRSKSFGRADFEAGRFSENQ
jgi:DNA-binding NtrC family response regulator